MCIHGMARWHGGRGGAENAWQARRGEMRGEERGPGLREHVLPDKRSIWIIRCVTQI